MSIDRAIQFNTTALALIGALFLGLGHRTPAMPLLLAGGAVAAAIVTDWKRWVLLNRLLANLVALVAVGRSMWGFMDLGSEEQLLAIANMLVWLQVVLLFQDKSDRVFWQLLVLSLLQVVVAAALNLGPEFGALLGPYIVLALTQLVLLCIHREVRREHPSAPRSAAKSPWTCLLAPPSVVPPGLAAGELKQALGGWTVARYVAILSVATILFAAVFFYATPRLNDTAWQGARGRAGGVSGVGSEVRLKESGRITLSNQVVMRAKLSRLSDRQAVPLVGEPYFTGATLTDYVTQGKSGRWVAPPRTVGGQRGKSSNNTASSTTTGALPPAPAPQTSTTLVRQDIVLEVGATPAYPAILPAQSLPNDTPNRLRYIRSLNRLERVASEVESIGRQYSYAFATPGIRNGRQLHAVPHPNLFATTSDADLSALIAFDAERFPKLAEIAARVIREQGASQGTQLERALALERHFRTPEVYQYSLDLDLSRNYDLDPIEDFVANHHTGYCEYFASALVMMLRSQGIPARMIIGYKGGELNTLGHYYVVQQRHAHAWVEAWIPPGEVVDWEIAGPSGGGVWYRLDPTPAARETITTAADDTLARRLAHAFDYVELLWRDYVLSLDKTRQENSFYDPLTAQATALPSWLEARTVHRWLRRWSAQLGIDVPQPARGGPRPFEGALGLLVAAMLLVAIGLIQAVLLARRQIGRWWTTRASSRRGTSQTPAFYLRLEKLLAHLPLRRQDGQTPRELAAAAENRLNASSEQRQAASIPAAIVAAYYRVRFGAARLDKTETAAIEHALERLAPAVRQAKSR